MITPRTPQTLASVADHYDELDPFYREIWGDHVHHGLWTTGLEDPAEAVIALIARIAEELALHPGDKICDIGCGYGATAEWLTKSFDVHTTGVTVSSAQMARARLRSDMDGRLRFLQQDWLENGFDGATFDALIAVESSEHMTDKQHFFDEAYRTLRDGGRLAVCAWLAKDDAKPWEERFLLEPICREGRLPSMGTEAEYRSWATQAGFEVRDFFDLSMQVRRTWAICAARVVRMILLDRRYRSYLRDARARHRIFALSLPRIWLAYTTGSMRYGLLVAAKPHASR
ncbi:SAM-dependent methyltransferase [Microvirga puerhi]|uniref:Class I SAM-dependent methyltransferase n=1 Tax=Microvirga puerhi TaxID=2876078 RepID=A0ABS7VN65_9HYPH|nr:class I SAM-dependent methyltransferase [Microvirga puerhi]MBZ6076961.1 class I SAM-dependent methyltransferase [Microvirga puerhi]